MTIPMVAVSVAQSVPGQVESETKVSATEGGFDGSLDPFDGFGYSLVSLGDLDGNGADDLVAGAPFDDDGGLNRGAVWILFLGVDGSVVAEQKISATAGDFANPLEDGARFGSSVAALGDLDGDGNVDLAVGVPALDDGGTDRGGVWVLFLRADGRVRSQAFIANPENGQAFEADNDGFGTSLTCMGDFNDNTLPDLVVGVTGDRGPVGLFPEGAIWIFELFRDGTPALSYKIDSESGGFTGVLEAADSFGQSVSSVGDLNGDLVGDLAVGAVGDGVAGSLWILFLAPNGTVTSHTLIDDTTPGLAGLIDPGDALGGSLSLLGDLNGDGFADLCAGTFAADDGGDAKGGVCILYLSSTGLPAAVSKISDTAGGLVTPLGAQDGFGFAVAGLADANGDDVPDLGVSAAFDDDGGPNQGAIYLLELGGIAPAKAESYGCGVNPENSLIVLGDLPHLGVDFELGIDNPLGTQPAGSFGLVLLSAEPAAGFPCGLSAPGFGMAGPGVSGEFLVGLSAPDLLVVAPAFTTFGGPGLPATMTAKVPAILSFLGTTYFAQGLLWDPGGPVEYGLSNALELRIGP